jgi:prepilin-type N-terminal cleavage/methylation domain-containing protein
MRHLQTKSPPRTGLTHLPRRCTDSASLSPRRSGFTLVELLVAMALTLFIMTILVEAFGAGMDTFQNLRALGDVQDTLRSATSLIKNDLSQNMFEGNRHLSDLNFWDEPRREGFFVATQGSRLDSSPSYVTEGTDLDLFNKSYLATDHRLNFSIRLRGNRRENFFFDSTGGTLYTNNAALRLSTTGQDREAIYGNTPLNAASTQVPLTSQWGEIAYFLLPMRDAAGQPVPIPDSDPKRTPGAPSYGPVYLYNLYRAAILTIPYADELNRNNRNALGFFRISRGSPGANGKQDFLSPNDFPKGAAFRTQYYDSTKPILSMNENAPLALVCTNVISFQIRIMKDPPTQNAVGYEDIPINAANKYEFDSAVKPAVGLGGQPYRLTGIQVVLRVFDQTTGLSRQSTVSQDL